MTHFFKSTACVVAVSTALLLAFSAPAFAQYNGSPVYNYGYNNNYNQSNEPLKVTCYPMPTSANIGDTVTWKAFAYGGNSGSYYYTWSGDEGLSGYGSTISKAYSYSGYKNASVSVISGGQTYSQNCDYPVNVRGTYVNQTPVYPPIYPTPYPYPTNYYYSPITVSCSANTTYASPGTTVTWTAYASGGNGYYNYSWSGSEGIYGSGQTIAVGYSYAGQKIASVTVSSNGQTFTQSCSNTVNVTGGSYGYTYPNNYNYNNYNYQQTQPVYPVNYQVSNYNGLDIGCFADPTNAKISQPVTWSVEVTGGSRPYSYSWTGSDGLTGSQSSVIKYYSTTGSKSAIVTVTSADGNTAAHACSNAVTVSSAATRSAVVYRTPTAPTQVSQTAPVMTPVATPVVLQNAGMSAVSLFSLANVPWGWIAVLVILVLFFTVLYMMFNKHKI